MNINEIDGNKLRQIDNFHRDVIYKLDSSTFNLGMGIIDEIIKRLNPEIRIAVDETGNWFSTEYKDIVFINKEKGNDNE